MPSHFANLANVSFADALLLFPATVVIHIWEEWPRFPRWARRFGSPTYSDRDYIVTHALAIVAAGAFVMLLRAISVVGDVVRVLHANFWTRRLLQHLVSCRRDSHFRDVCPGVVSGLFLYLPLSRLLVVLGLRERLFTGSFIVFTVAVAAAFHTIEIGHSVFKRW